MGEGLRRCVTCVWSRELGCLCGLCVMAWLMCVCIPRREMQQLNQQLIGLPLTDRWWAGTKFSLLHQVDALAKPPSKVNDLYVGDHHRLFNIIKSNRFCAITIQLVVRILWSVKIVKVDGMRTVLVKKRGSDEDGDIFK